ncbi:MAG TPA: efflux transporter outer membrane subunit [Acetobacteraceae bacterium]|jgi:multidrug efflux system outer membrane protein|nr:efflux transporter outer membrane subunit [Acetobacteraceae bacterium]
MIRLATRGMMPVVVLLGGCNLGPDYQRPEVEMPVEFRATPATEAAAWPSEDWWRGFKSHELNSLIEQARVQNFDIAAAIARVRQADAQVRIAGAPLLPTVTATGNASWQQVGATKGFTGVSRGGSTTSTINIHSYSLTPLNAAYEVDFWGLNRAAQQAAVSSAVFSRFDQEVVALTVVTNVANTWFTALGLADRLVVAQNNLADAEHTLAVIRGRLDAGTASALDIAQQEALVAGERAVIPGLRNQLEQELIGLGILVGRPPEAIDARPGSLDTLSLPPVSPGLPSSLLERRPDVAEIEAELVAQNFDIKVARAAFFPAVTLTGSYGFANAALNTLFSPGGTLVALAAGFTQPLFDAGTLRGQLELTKGKYDELLADYRKAVIQAFTDVENALTAWRFTTEQEALQRQAVATAQRAADIARAQMMAGTVDITTVLQAETTLFNDQDLLAQVRLTRFQALLALYKALGGGWVQPPGPIPDQFPGLKPGRLPGGIALPVGGNVR